MWGGGCQQSSILWGWGHNKITHHPPNVEIYMQLSMASFPANNMPLVTGCYLPAFIIQCLPSLTHLVSFLCLVLAVVRSHDWAGPRTLRQPLLGPQHSSSAHLLSISQK